MGVATYVQGYKKNEDCISGKIQSIGWFEVNKNKIQDHKIENSFMVFHEELHSLMYIMRYEVPYDLGFYDLRNLTFYYHIVDYITGNGYCQINNEPHEVMFDGKNVLEALSSIYNVFDRLPLDEEIKTSEKEILKELIEILTIISNNDGIVSFTLG